MFMCVTANKKLFEQQRQTDDTVYICIATGVDAYSCIQFCCKNIPLSFPLGLFTTSLITIGRLHVSNKSSVQLLFPLTCPT